MNAREARTITELSLSSTSVVIKERLQELYFLISETAKKGLDEVIDFCPYKTERHREAVYAVLRSLEFKIRRVNGGYASSDPREQGDTWYISW